MNIKLSEWITAVIVSMFFLIVCSAMDGEAYQDRKMAAESLKEAVQAEQHEAAELKRIYARLSAEGAYMTGMVAAK